MKIRFSFCAFFFGFFDQVANSLYDTFDLPIAVTKLVKSWKIYSWRLAG